MIMTEVQNNEFGVNVWWHIPEFVMDGNLVQEVVEKHGFEKEDLPLPSRRSVISRAVYSFQDRRHKLGRTVVDKVKDNSEQVAYGILYQKRKASDEVGYDQGTTVTLDKESNRVNVSGSLATDVYSSIEKFEDTIASEDVSKFLRKVVKMSFGISKRKVSGGIYFVPDRFTGLIESAQEIVNELNIGAKLYVERVMNGEQERAIVWDAVENNIESEIEKTMGAVERISKRASSVKSKQAKLDEMNGLMDIYKQLLGQEAKYEEITEKLNDASIEVASKLTELQNASTTAKVKTGGSGYKRSKIKVSIIPAVEEVLENADKAMHYKEIAEALKEHGVELRATKTKTEAQWVAIQINTAVRENTSTIEAMGKGFFTVKSRKVANGKVPNQGSNTVENLKKLNWVAK
jgi:hypothetical protein